MLSETPASKLPVYSNLGTYISEIEKFPAVQKEGRVMQVIGHMVEATNPGCSVGGMCKIYNPATKSSVTAEVVGFRKDRMLIMPCITHTGSAQSAGLSRKIDRLWYQ